MIANGFEVAYWVKKILQNWGIWLVQWVEHVILGLRVMNSSPILGVEPIKNIYISKSDICDAL